MHPFGSARVNSTGERVESITPVLNRLIATAGKAFDSSTGKKVDSTGIKAVVSVAEKQLQLLADRRLKLLERTRTKHAPTGAEAKKR